MGRKPVPFNEQLNNCKVLPKRKIEIKTGHFYWRKPLGPYVVFKVFQKNGFKKYLHYGTARTEEKAKALSVEMCHIINDKLTEIGNA